jgi:hypothetical protein
MNIFSSMHIKICSVSVLERVIELRIMSLLA